MHYLPDLAVDTMTHALWLETHETACTNPMDWAHTRTRARTLLRAVVPSLRASALVGAANWFRKKGRMPDCDTLEVFASVERLNDVLDPMARRVKV